MTYLLLIYESQKRSTGFLFYFFEIFEETIGILMKEYEISQQLFPPCKARLYPIPSRFENGLLIIIRKIYLITFTLFNWHQIYILFIQKLLEIYETINPCQICRERHT